MPQIRIVLWKASTAFNNGYDVLCDPKWREIYPELYIRQTYPDDPCPINSQTILPVEIVLEMARRSNYMFAGGENGLACYHHDRSYVPATIKMLTPLEALLKYGSEMVFEAVDKGSSPWPVNNETLDPFAVQMQFWKAQKAFESWEAVIHDPKWRVDFPQLYMQSAVSEGSLSMPPQTILPYRVVVAMAMKSARYFSLSPIGLLTCHYHNKPENLSWKDNELTALEAVMRCGSESVFVAVDKGCAKFGLIDELVPGE